MNTFATPNLSYVKLYLSVLVILLISLKGYGQDEQKDLETDRPDETEAASVIPIKTLQFETGFYIQKDRQKLRESKMMQYPVVLVRLGLLRWFEFRAQSAYQITRMKGETGGSEAEGFAPLTLGAKVALWQEQGGRPQAAFMVMVDFPVIGSRTFRSNKPEPEFRLMFKNTLTEGFDLNYNLVYNLVDGSPIRGYAVSVSTLLIERVTIYAEVFGEKQHNESATHSADAGILFLILPTLQLDIAAGMAINSFAPDYFITTGLSFRIPN